MNTPSFLWGSLNAEEFSHVLEVTYREVVHWRPNSFKVPTGNSGKDFVYELERLFSTFASASSMESIALKATIVMPILLLQKPHRKSKTKDHIACLQRRLHAWKEGNLNELTLEGRTIQKRFPKVYHQSESQNLHRSFANLMFAGKTKGALDLLSHSQPGGVLHLQDPSEPGNQDSPTVRETLINKHPQGQQVNPNCIVSSPPQEIHPVIFDSIDANAIRAASLKITGAAGPSGLDAHEWRRLCTTFGRVSTNLCSALADVAKRLCTTYVDPKVLSPLLASRLIALNKNPGVRPIGIGDTARRIIAKAVLFTVRPDIQDATGCIQLCGGQISGIEAAVHAVRSTFALDSNEAVLLVDASNAFNALNRQTALHNISRICPPLSTILINTYRVPTDLFIDGDTIQSQEGTTQGDPLAMPMYALATIPLIRELIGTCKQFWYADDAAVVGKLTDLRDWWDRLVTLGPQYGYFPNPSKTWLVTKDGLCDTANSIFASTGVKVTPDGRPYLGAAIGSPEYISSYVESKVTEWVATLHRLAEIASTQPHAAFCALTRGLMSKWSYLSRTIPDIGPLLRPLDDVISLAIIPALTGRPPPGELERSLLALPARMGGLGIGIPSESAINEYQASQQVTATLCDHIISQDLAYCYVIVTKQLEAKAQVSHDIKERKTSEFNDIYEHLSSQLQRAVDLATEKGSSSWLTTLPLEEHGFALHKRAFHDALALRYGWSPSEMPSKCACGNNFTVEHALSCAKGGFPSIRHNEVRDLTATLLTEVCNNVSTEPYLQPISNETLTGATANTQDGARLDIAANGFWGGTYERTFFDVRVFNPHAPSNRRTPLPSCYRRHEQAKKRTYEQRCREVEHASFTPLVLSATGGLAKEATVFYKRLASKLASKWDANYSSTLCWLRCRLAFSLLRSAIQAIRGARSSRGNSVRVPSAVDLVNTESGVNE